MGLTVEKAFFANLSDVLDDVKSNGTWPTTFVSGPSKGLPEHYHDYEVHAYVMEGETWFGTVIQAKDYMCQRATR